MRRGSPTVLRASFAGPSCIMRMPIGEDVVFGKGFFWQAAQEGHARFGVGLWKTGSSIPTFKFLTTTESPF